MDNNVPPYNTLLVADALIKANKDFDCCSSRTRGTDMAGELHDAAAVGLLREVPADAESAAGLRDSLGAGRRAPGVAAAAARLMLQR